MTDGKQEDTWSRLQDAITRVTGLLAGIAAFVAKALNVAGALPQVVQWLLAAGIVGFGIYLWRYANRRGESRGGDPRKLDSVLAKHAGILGRNVPPSNEQLDDLAQLLDICRTQSVATLVGVPGVGKTASLRYGVLPQLKQPGDSLAVFVTDWDDGALHALGRALDRAKAELAAAMPPTPVPGSMTLPDLAATPAAGHNVAQRASQWSPQVIAKSIDELHRQTGRVLLFILDEFDDYLLSQNHKSPSASALTLEELEPLHPVWSLLKDAVSQGKARVLFTRQARAEGVDPDGTRRLLPIDASYWRAITTDLIESGFVLRPENGWTELSERIGADLAVNGTTLPFRVVIACRGLRNLGKSLTPRTYDSIGGLTGLEEDWLLKQVDSAFNGLADRALAWQLLYALANDPPFDGADRKARWTLTNLVARFADLEVGTSGVVALLKELKRRQITRAMITDDGSVVWSLYHPLLRLPLRRIRERGQRAQALLHARTTSWKLLHFRELAMVSYGLARRRAKLEKRSYGLLVVSFVRLGAIGVLIAALTLLAIDGGLDVPGARSIRRALERRGCSLAAWPKSPETVQVAATSMTNRLSKVITERKGGTEPKPWAGWIHPDPPDAAPRANHDYWAHAQASAALAIAHAADRRLGADPSELISVMMASVTTDQTSRKLGWVHNEGERSILAQPILWLGIAAARYQQIDPRAAEQGNVGTAEFWAEIDAMLAPFYHDGKWNQFLDQEDEQLASVYVSSLALEYLVERWRSDRQTASGRKLDRRLAATFEWLQRQYVNKAEALKEGLGDVGWREGKANGFKDALSLEVFAAMLLADSTGDPRLRILDDDYQELSTALVDWTENGVNASGYYKVSVKDPGAAGSLLVYDKFITYVWYPWAVQCATRWLRTARDHGADEGTIRLIRGRLGRLIVGRREQVVTESGSSWTFLASEHLYGLDGAAAAYARSGGTSESPAPTQAASLTEPVQGAGRGSAAEWER